MLPAHDFINRRKYLPDIQMQLCYCPGGTVVWLLLLVVLSWYHRMSEEETKYFPKVTALGTVSLRRKTLLELLLSWLRKQYF